MEFRNVHILGMQFSYELNLDNMFSLVTSKNFMQLFLNHPEQKYRFLQPSCMYCIASYIPTCFFAELPCILLKHTCVYNSLPLPLYLYVLLSLSLPLVQFFCHRTPLPIFLFLSLLSLSFYSYLFSSYLFSSYLSLPISSLPIFPFPIFYLPPIYSFTSASPPLRSCIQANSANTGFSFRI